MSSSTSGPVYKATQSPGGQLLPLTQCTITVSGAAKPITLNNLPEISDSKGASYTDEPIMGRSSPFKTYSHSDNRTISMTIHFIAVTSADLTTNLANLRLIESCVYPRTSSTTGTPFLPPPICQIQCGALLGTNPLCVVLRQYSVKFPTDVPWNNSTASISTAYLPWKFDLDTTWEAVYVSASLPGQETIMSMG